MKIKVHILPDAKICKNGVCVDAAKHGAKMQSSLNEWLAENNYLVPLLVGHSDANSSPSLGNIESARYEPGEGLFLKVGVTDEATQKAILQKKFTRVSAYLDFDAKDHLGKLWTARIHEVSLTNAPAVHNQRPLQVMSLSVSKPKATTSLQAPVSYKQMRLSTEIEIEETPVEEENKTILTNEEIMPVEEKVESVVEEEVELAYEEEELELEEAPQAPESDAEPEAEVELEVEAQEELEERVVALSAKLEELVARVAALEAQHAEIIEETVEEEEAEEVALSTAQVVLASTKPKRVAVKKPVAVQERTIEPKFKLDSALAVVEATMQLKREHKITFAEAQKMLLERIKK